MSSSSNNIVWHSGEIDRAKRAQAHGHKGVTLWFTGLSGSGKSTVAYRVERLLVERGMFAYVLDGDNLRHGLNRGLGFSKEDREENIRRVGEVSQLFTDAGAIVLSAFVSPYKKDRQSIRERMAGGDFVEVYVSTPLEVCEARDPKGLYRRARAGEITDFTGVNAPYEPPESPEISISTEELAVEECAEQVIDYLRAHGYIGEQNT